MSDKKNIKDERMTKITRRMLDKKIIKDEPMTKNYTYCEVIVCETNTQNK
jgi:hypothetical protein